MNFFDDLRMRVEQAGQNAGKDLQTYIQNNIITPAVKIGEAAKGNLSETQIANGQTGQAPAISIPANVQTAAVSILPILAIGAIAYFVFSKKGRK